MCALLYVILGGVYGACRVPGRQGKHILVKTTCQVSNVCNYNVLLPMFYHVLTIYIIDFHFLIYIFHFVLRVVMARIIPLDPDLITTLKFSVVVCCWLCKFWSRSSS